VLVEPPRTGGRLTQWQGEARNSAALAAAKSAAFAAYKAALPPTMAKLQPLALKLARAKLRSAWKTYLTRWRDIDRKFQQELRYKKERFFAAESATVAHHAAAELRSFVWKHMPPRGIKRINEAAKRTAHRVSLRLVSRFLGPKFVSAAVTSLPHAVRTGAKQGMQVWRSGWNGKV